MPPITGIRVIIWDFDGTLYKQIPELWEGIRTAELTVIMEHTGWTMERAREEFYRVYKVRTPSGTQTVSILTGMPNSQASVESSRKTDYERFLAPDPRLPALFSALSGYRHYMLVNGSRDSVRRGLAAVGLDASLFTEIVTSEIVGVTKPEPDGYRYILKQTGLPAHAHLMVGDREPVDLVPAKELGLKTCLVWSQEPGTVADVTLNTVYELPGVLG